MQKHLMKKRRGAVVIYVVLMIVILLAFCSLAVDYGRVTTTKTELQRTSDAAARAGAMVISSGTTTVRTAAKSVASANKANGTSVVLADTDVLLGTWSSGAFTVTTTNPNAVRVTSRRTQATGNAVPLLFASVIGLTGKDVTARSTAVYVSGVNVDVNVPATGNPWLAGMPDGTIANPGNPHKNPDRAPANNPVLISGLPLVAGSVLTFDSISGDARHDPNLADYNPDGNLSSIWENFGGAEHGKSNLRSPINALIGVFLPDGSPTATSAPEKLDFSTAASRDFTSLSPKLKQVFFIGNGKTSSGATQSFIVPQGATRFYLGTMDGYEWNNNSGSRNIRVQRPGQVMLVD